MNFEIKIEPDHSFATIRPIGDPTAEGIVAYWRALFADPEWRSGTPILVDAREMNIGTVDSTAVRQIAGLHREFANELRQCRVATIVSETSHYGMFRMFQILADEAFGTFEGFYTEEDAMKWLLKPI